MVLLGNEFPESKLNDLQYADVNVQLNFSSSDESDDDQNDLNYYQALPSHDIEVKNEIEEDIDEDLKNERQLEVNTELVLDAMKNVKLEPGAIPEWAKSLSDDNWKEVLGKVQNK